MKVLPTYEELFQVFDYCTETGLISRKIKTAISTKVGDIAGHINAQGYVIVKYKTQAYKAHRLAWLLYYKQWPEHDVDHIDGNKSNNSIKNLRDVPRSINALNTKPISSNKSGYRGVSLHNGKWRARIMINGKSTIIGTFNTPEEASEAYITFKKNL